MGSPVTTSRCVQMLRAASRCHENSRRRLKTGFGHGAPSLEKHRRIFFHFCFSGGSCKNGICIYIYMCTYVGIYIFILYVSSTVSIVTSCFFLTTLELVSPPWSFNCRTPGVSWTASSPAGQRRCSWKRHLV
jgi:hypothetical protein